MRSPAITQGAPSADEQKGPLYLRRTPVRDRRILWAGTPFRSQLLPYVFHRWDVVFDIFDPKEWDARAVCYMAGFARRSTAEKYIASS